MDMCIAQPKKTIVWYVYYINDKTELLKTYKIRKMGNWTATQNTYST